MTRAEDGHQVADINGAVGHEEVPPGIYNVSFSNGLWRGVEVKPGETTVLEVGLLRIEGGASDLKGYVILDPETEEVVVRQRMIATIPLMPGRFIITSGHIGMAEHRDQRGPDHRAQPSAHRRDRRQRRRISGHDQRRPRGRQVSRLFQLPLPAGSYVVDVEGQPMKVDLVDGQTHTIDVP